MGAFRLGCLGMLAIFSFCLRPCPAAAEAPAFLTPLPIQQGEAAGFAVYQSVPVDVADAGMTGSLQILQDQRVTPRYRKSWGSSADPLMALGPNDPLLQRLRAHPLRNGRIRLVDHNGHVVAVASFREPLAKIATEYLYGTKFPTYLVTVDFGIGIGSYAGPATTLVEVRSKKLIALPIVLGRSLKNGWKIVPASSGAGKEIEEVQCHPDFAQPSSAATTEFVVEYSTYRFVHGEWRKKTVQKTGFWEADDAWPPRGLFP